MMLWQITLYVFSVWMFYALLTVGFGLILRSVKFFNMAYGGAFLLGGYTMFWFYHQLDISFVPALVLSLAISGLYLALTYQFIFRILSRRKAENLILLIASFGLLIATAAALGMIFGNQTTVITRELSEVSVLNIFGATLNIIEATASLGVLIIIAVLAYVRFQTRFGRAARAIEDDAEVAELVGISKDQTLLKIFFISGMLAGLAGIIEGLDVGIIPASGLIYILPTIVAAVIGGMRSFWGGVLGAFVLAVVQQLTIMFFGQNWVQAVPFVILIAVLLVRPQGILKR